MYVKDLFKKYAEWKILHFFLNNPNKKIHVKELSRTLEISSGTASKALNSAHKDKILNKKIIANVHLYSLNNQNETVRKLKRVVKTL